MKRKLRTSYILLGCGTSRTPIIRNLTNTILFFFFEIGKVCPLTVTQSRSMACALIACAYEFLVGLPARPGEEFL